MSKHDNRILIATLLHDLLYLDKRTDTPTVCWIDTKTPVAEREWLTVLHEAEKVLDKERWMRVDYINRLGGYDDHWASTHADEDQKSEALLATLKAVRA